MVSIAVTAHGLSNLHWALICRRRWIWQHLPTYFCIPNSDMSPSQSQQDLCPWLHKRLPLPQTQSCPDPERKTRGAAGKSFPDGPQSCLLNLSWSSRKSRKDSNAGQGPIESPHRLPALLTSLQKEQELYFSQTSYLNLFSTLSLAPKQDSDESKLSPHLQVACLVLCCSLV